MESASSTETMKDYEKELERSFRTISEGDIVSGTVIAVSEEDEISSFPERKPMMYLHGRS